MSHQGDSLEVIRVRTRETLARPDIAQLVMRGARACALPQPAGVLAELLLEVGDERIGIFVGLASDQPQFVVVGFYPRGAFWIAATVGLVYAERAPRLLVGLVSARLREWFCHGGHHHVIVHNLLHTDRSYMRGLAHFGRPSRIGSAIRFDLGDE